jgi:hypothetical protein
MTHSGEVGEEEVITEELLVEVRPRHIVARMVVERV